MAREAEPIPIDISDDPDLLRLAEEVRRTRSPRLLRRGDEDLAVLSPVRPKRLRVRRHTDDDYRAFLSSAGGWKGLVDTERLKEDIAESRRLSVRPAIEL